jgi:biotin synthase
MKGQNLLRTGVRTLTKPQPIIISRKYGTVQNVGPSLTTPQLSVFDNAIAADSPRNTWTKEEIKEIYDTPLMKLAFAAVSQLPPFRIID